MTATSRGPISFSRHAVPFHLTSTWSVVGFPAPRFASTAAALAGVFVAVPDLGIAKGVARYMRTEAPRR